MVKLRIFANSGDPDQTRPHCTAFDLGLHCLPVSLLEVSRLNGLTLLKAVLDEELQI